MAFPPLPWVASCRAGPDWAAARPHSMTQATIWLGAMNRSVPAPVSESKLSTAMPLPARFFLPDERFDGLGWVI